MTPLKNTVVAAAFSIGAGSAATVAWTGSSTFDNAEISFAGLTSDKLVSITDTGDLNGGIWTTVFSDILQRESGWVEDLAILVFPSGPAEISGIQFTTSRLQSGKTVNSMADVKFNFPDVTANATIAVPGPIAGAGLPALLALGGFVWARRRKAAVPAAA